MSLKDTLHYAHCVRFTPGQLDREPFSLYESRQADIEIVAIHSDDGPEWQILHNGKIIACEIALKDAQALAIYELMNKSRDAAYHAAATLRQSQNKPIKP